MAMIVGISSAALVYILIRKEGPVHTLKKYIAYYYLKHLKKKRKHRLESLYDINTCDPYKFGILIQPTERYLEFPRTHLNPQTDDNFLIFGVNSKKERLVVRISKTSSNQANIWVYLSLPDGKRYVLDDSEKSWKVPRTADDTFAAGGLRIRCLTPMRRWRVSYNGMLRECSSSSATAQYAHVKFSFIWVPSSTVVDIYEDMADSVLSKYLASEKWEGWLPDTERVKECLDSYEQSGMLLGTVSIDSEEETELYLWGGRKRSIEMPEKVESSLDFFGSLKDGDYFHVCRLTLTNSGSSLDYGCIMLPTGHVHVMDDFTISVPDGQDQNDKVFLNNASINFKRDKILYTIKINAATESQTLGESHVHFAPMTMNDDVGEVMIVYTNRTSRQLLKPQVAHTLSKSKAILKSPFVAKITDLTSEEVDLAGGKGASLGELSHLAKNNNETLFSVPKGLIVTTKAYESFLSAIEFQDEILHLENTAWKNGGDLKKCCERTMNNMKNKVLPKDIQSAVANELNEIFGEALENVKFAVRSSAVGEDSEEMSAAGQMETFLGVRGIPEITSCIVKCWASQFSYTAIQYKRQNGQLLNTPMAVVVQEMVSADTAGVIFTCDPVTGNPSLLTITANYGLGESVVSASAEPDTICLEHSKEDDFRFRNVDIGKKGTKITLSGKNGTEEIKTTEQESRQCCIDSESALALARASLEVEKHFACPMDIEWAIKGSQVYLLQARPVTTYDRETDFEIRHAIDTCIPCENEYTSKANVGEVMSGASSPSGITGLFALINTTIAKKWAERKITIIKFNPYLWKGFVVSQSHFFFAVLDSILRFHKKEGSIIGDSQMIAMFGRVVEDDDMIEAALSRSKKDTSTHVPYRIIFYLFYDVFFVERRLQKAMKSIQTLAIDFKGLNDASQMFEHTMYQMFNGGEHMAAHGDCTFASSIFNLSILYILRSARGEWHDDVYKDFASLVSNCPEVESVDVPRALQKLATAIGQDINPSTFKKMETEEALHWLQTTDTNAGKMYAEFMKNHGHRCLNELDLYAKPWNFDPTHVIKSLKEMVGRVGNEKPKTKELSSTELLGNLKIQLNWKQRLMFRFFLPFCRRAVGQRERSKSVIVKGTDVMRQAFRSVEAKMIEEGRLPEKDLIFFLTFTEIHDLLRTRSPRLVQNALRRKGMHKSLSKLLFPEIMHGVPTPMNLRIREETNFQSSLTMKGIPVSLGVVKGIARVAVSLEEAALIQPGEILIAYGTDIGWSPYFPMLAGVATELGGLISHGAVVAREYGLPCVVGLHGATSKFQSGDLVILDGSKGTLTRIEQDTVESNGNITTSHL